MNRLKVVSAHVAASGLTVGACASEAPILKNFIGGEFKAASEAANAKSIPVTNPHDGHVIARVPQSGAAEVDAAVAAAAAAWPEWRDTPVKARVEILFRFKALLEESLDELTALVVKEHGKNAAEAKAEVLKGIEGISFATGLPDVMAGRTLEVSNGVTCQEIRRPLGVVVSIVPFNFPAMVPLWTLPIAIGCGNCLIMKPSEKVPLTLCRMAELLTQAGCPKGVLSLVHGAQDAVTGLVEHKGVSAVSFVGSSRVAQIVDSKARATGKRALCMGGAKNHLIVMPDADEQMTIDDIMNSAFGSAGQRCMAASVMIVVGKGRKEFLDKLVAKAASLKPGQGAGEIGPLIDQGAVDRVASYIGDSTKHGGEVLLDGRGWKQSSPTGLYMGPTVVKHQSASEPAVREEIFGPVLSVLEVNSLDEAIEIENSNPYGNAAAIYTSSGATALAAKRLSAGMLGVNIGIPVPREPFSFGGIGQSKFGDTSDITGIGSAHFFTELIKITSKWAPPSKKADVVTKAFIN